MFERQVPWLAAAFLLGVVLMVAAAVAGEASWSLPVLLVGVVGAFFATAAVGHSLIWGGVGSRRLLRVCAGSFLVGLGLVAVAAYLGERSWKWALTCLCPGVYLLFFAYQICVQGLPASGRWLATLAALLLAVGGIVGAIGLRELPLFLECQATPREVTLSDLLEHGWGDNRHVRLSGFRVSARLVVDRLSGEPLAQVLFVWFPVMPRGTPADADPLAVPRKVRAVVRGTMAPGATRVPRTDRPFEGIVVNGVRRLSERARKELSDLAPETDFDRLLMIEEGKPPAAEFVLGTLGGGVAGVLVGVLLGVILFRRAWRQTAQPENGETGTWEKRKGRGGRK